MTLKTNLDFISYLKNHRDMKNKTNWLIISLILTMGLFIYLTIHHYAVQLGMNGPGLCSINSQFNCDAAATSSYAEIFKIPIAVFGLCFNFVMLMVVLFRKWSWTEESNIQNGAVQLLFLVSGVLSIVLGAISIFKIHVVCPFCVATYLFSFINFFLVLKTFSPAKYAIWPILTYKPNLIMGVTVLVLAWFISGMIQDSYGLSEIKKIVPEKIALWQNSPSFNFSESMGIIKNSNSKIILVEFADFKCPHCKVASQSIHNFLKGHSEIKFIFKPFPLDGTCNPAITQKGDGSRCKMAAWVLCSDKIAKKGFDVHTWYFENQENLSQVSEMKNSNLELAKILNLNYEEIESCSESVTTYDEIKKISEEAKAAKVEGTPTVFLNGKKLEYGHFTEILKTAVQTLN